ncbi:unnamed protein product [Calicophoron daubneyi]|uniref:Uncharacterized protein n=1 Tax=Calicophoron daubneyi TaxID=300641 RepID=A0AAV2TBH2_CALDB
MGNPGNDGQSTTESTCDRNNMRINNVGASIQMRRMRFRKRIQAKNGIIKQILESRMKTKKMEGKPADAKSWLRQIKRDMDELHISDIEKWGGSKPTYDSDYRSRLVGERNRNIKYLNDHCERMFAAVNEMNRREERPYSRKEQSKIDQE